MHDNVPKPLALEWLQRVAPIYLARFDHEDIIRSITERPGDSRCIHFETVFGDSFEDCEACVDAKNGWLLSIRQGDVTTRNSNFFPFAGSFLPGHVERSIGSTLLIAVDQTVVPKDFPSDLFNVPENTMGPICQEFRSACEINTPQPEPRSSPDMTDVTLVGYIDLDGHAKRLKSLDPTRPELGAEAMKEVSTWTYTPATCNGRRLPGRLSSSCTSKALPPTKKFRSRRHRLTTFELLKLVVESREDVWEWQLDRPAVKRIAIFDMVQIAASHVPAPCFRVLPAFLNNSHEAVVRRQGLNRNRKRRVSDRDLPRVPVTRQTSGVG